MKKVIIAAALISAIGFTGLKVANAHGNYGTGYGNCNGNGYGTSFTENDVKQRETFWAETKTTRKELFVKRNELNALLNQDNPDEKKVASLSGELHDLETQLAENAESKGIRGGNGYGHVPGMMGNGRWGRGRHMMDW